MPTTRKAIRVETRSNREWAPSASRPRLPVNTPTTSLRAAMPPLAIIDAVATRCFARPLASHSIVVSLPTLFILRGEIGRLLGRSAHLTHSLPRPDLLLIF